MSTKTVEQAIYDQYGVRLGPSSGDGKHRAFKIDQFRNGYLLKLTKVACFGSVIDGECFVWQNGQSVEVDRDWRKDSSDIRFEWKVWEIAKASIERGEKLTSEDADRLAMAVKRLESWL